MSKCPKSVVSKNIKRTCPGFTPRNPVHTVIKVSNSVERIGGTLNFCSKLRIVTYKPYILQY